MKDRTKELCLKKGVHLLHNKMPDGNPVSQIMLEADGQRIASGTLTILDMLKAALWFVEVSAVHRGWLPSIDDDEYNRLMDQIREELE